MAARSFALEAGAIGVLQLADREEKIAAIELAVGERVPDAGTITMNGVALDQAPAGSIGWVPEHGGLIGNLKAWENVTLPLWYHGKRHVADTEASTLHWLAELGVGSDAMERLMASPAGFLPPLEWKRVGLLRGLVLAPKLLVVDAALFHGLSDDVRMSWYAALDSFVRTAEESSILVAAEGDAALPWANIG